MPGLVIGRPEPLDVAALASRAPEPLRQPAGTLLQLLADVFGADTVGNRVEPDASMLAPTPLMAAGRAAKRLAPLAEGRLRDMLDTATQWWRADGDVVTGDVVRFKRAMFDGWPKPKYLGDEIVQGRVIGDSYGKGTGQHTFTLELPDGGTTRIKGRNLYANGVERLPWQEESERIAVAAEKHARGDVARAERAARRDERGW